MCGMYLSLKSGSEIHGVATPVEGREVNLTEDVAGRIGYAFALWLAEREEIAPDELVVAVGHDARMSGDALKAAIIRGVTAADSDVYDCGLCATPAIYLATVLEDKPAHGAVMIAASRGEYYENGLKLITRAGLITGDEVEEILVRAAKLKVPNRLVTKLDLMAQYSENLKDTVRDRMESEVQLPLLGLRVVVDAGGGTGGFYAELLSSLGAEVTGSRLEPDGLFGEGIPNPSSRAAMERMARTVIDEEADMGILFDADCSRVAIVDSDGRAINGNRLIALAAAIILEDEPGATFVTDSVTSSGLTRFITEWGGVHYRYKRGYRDVIGEAIRLNEENIYCPLAIETSGHSAMRDNYFHDDGIHLATWLICEAIYRKRDGLTLGSLIDELQEPVESEELRLKIVDEDVRRASQAVIEVILSHTLENTSWHLAQDNREGVRILFDLDGEVENAWFMIRLSVHDPVMPLNAESDAPGGVRLMLGELYALLSENEMDAYVDLEPLQRAAGR